jgi:RNA polymerase sigma factor (sigma-70 family)
LVKDAVQDLFLNIFIRKGTLADVDNIEPYLKTPLRHDLVRRIVASQKQISFNEFTENNSLTECLRSLHSHDSEEREITFMKLDKEVKNLPKRAFHAVTMRYFAGKSNQEVADQMGTNYQSATNNIHRGIETLRVVMSGAVF